eukprot:CAMPEP_0202443350 /NCGR_PEP_ID=MMETSP1360-20130828/2648_1 /ASSEMBLY_ACC=CAM_ASM_000848 /TAXON_ID=515479 /ORGANISM="Licmophora paradoxa, Strain CCMP2313" /LENGTH=495 /DNA_ID=CAMNT_0049059023 /DNA_START=31 /DNA_END=1518 /DNA_ORIENTATION=-
MSESTPNATPTASTKIQGMWTTLRSTFDESDARLQLNFQKVKEAMDTGDLTLEQVVKQIFGVCTSGSAGTTNNNTNILKNDSRSICDPHLHHNQCTSSSSSIHNNCTSSNNRRRTSPKIATAIATANATATDTRHADQGQGQEEYFFAQFLAEERRKAQNTVVSSKRELQQHSNRNISPNRTTTRKPTSTNATGQPISRPFPVSTPPRNDTLPFRRLPKSSGAPAPPPAAPILLNSNHHPAASRGVILTTSFDDEISAISAHTLEEMVRQDEIRKHRALGPVRSDLTSELEGGGGLVENSHSMESTLFPPTPKRDSGSPRNNKHKSNTMLLTASSNNSSPVSLSRGKSYTSKRSHATKSTQSTATNTFESVWRRDEQRYWETVVEEDEHRSYPYGTTQSGGKSGRKGSRDLLDHSRIQPDKTFGTSSTTSWSSHRHPHDTIQYESSDFCLGGDDDDDEEEVPMTTKVVHVGEARFDPDRLQEVLVLNHETELGEI